MNKRENERLASHSQASRPIEQCSTSHNCSSIKHIHNWVCMSGALVWVSSIWTIHSPWFLSFYTIFIHYACIRTTFAFYYSLFERVAHTYKRITITRRQRWRQVSLDFTLLRFLVVMMLVVYVTYIYTSIYTYIYIDVHVCMYIWGAVIVVPWWRVAQ